MMTSTEKQPGATLTKSQKKRMKKKKAKAAAAAGGGDDISPSPSTATTNKDDDDDDDEDVAAAAAPEVVQPPAGLNPIEQMRFRLTHEGGCTLKEVDDAMNEMWEKELSYDEYDSVLAYINEKKFMGSIQKEAKKSGSGAAATKAPAPAAPAPVVTPVVSAPAPVPVATTTTPAPAVVNNDSPAPAVMEDHSPPAMTMTEESKEEEPVVYNIDLPTKLELVAKYCENVHDSIYAIGEMVKTLGAQQSPQRRQEIINMLIERDIVGMLVKRSIVECSQSESEFVKLLPHLLNLVVTVFPSPSSISKSGYRDSLTKVLNAARRAMIVSKEADLSTDETIQIGEVVAKALSNTLMKSSSSGKKNGASVASTAAVGAGTNGSGIAALFQRREAAKAAVVDYGMSSNEDDDSGTLAASTSKIFEDHTPQLYRMFQDNQIKHDKYANEFDTLERSFENEKQLEQDALRDCQTQKLDLQTRKRQLMAELKSIEEQQVLLEAQEISLQNTLNGLEDSFQTKTYKTQDLLKETKQILGVAKACDKIESTLSTLEQNLKGGSGGITTNDASTNNMSMEDYVKGLLDYFVAETSLYDTLNHRYESLTLRRNQIEREMTECRNLGLTMNVSQLQSSFQRMTYLIDDDSTTMTTMLDDAKTMMNRLVANLRNNDSALSDTTTVFYLKKLKQVIVGSSMSKTVDVTDLTSLLPPDDVNDEDEEQKDIDIMEHPVVIMDEYEPSPPPSFPNTPSAATVVRPPPAAAVAPVVTETAPMPKLSWAAKLK